LELFAARAIKKAYSSRSSWSVKWLNRVRATELISGSLRLPSALPVRIKPLKASNE
jgi:hypothetical protein